MGTHHHEHTKDENRPMGHEDEDTLDESQAVTSSEGSSSADEWKVPVSAESGMDEPAGSASAPDPSPLLGQDNDAPIDGVNRFWSEGGTISGTTSNSQRVPPQQ